MNKLLNADEARQLSGTNAKEEVEMIMGKIEGAAKNGRRRLDLHDNFWVNEGYSKTKKWNEAKKILEDLGYKVSFYYQVHSIAVDMYTYIEW